MAQFRTPASVTYPGTKWPLGPWPDPSGSRMFVRGNSGVELIGIETGQTLTLQLAGGRGLRIESEETRNARRRPGASPAGKVVVKDEVAMSDRHTFTVKGLSAGSTVLYALDSLDRAEAELFVSVGHFENHPGMEVDLIAAVMRGHDSTRIHALLRMLHDDPDNIFNQNAYENRNITRRERAEGSRAPADDPNWTCGMVARDRGVQVFGQSTLTTFDWYRGGIYASLSQRVKADRSNLRYLPARLGALVQKVAAQLRAGKAVMLAVVDAPQFLTPVNGRFLAYHAGGHTVLAVGCNATNTEFLYIDPWYNGSQMRYGGGHAPNRFGETSRSLGIMVVEHDGSRAISASDLRPNIMRTKPSTYGTFNATRGTVMEVVTGPFAEFLTKS